MTRRIPMVSLFAHSTRTISGGKGIYPLAKFLLQTIQTARTLYFSNLYQNWEQNSFKSSLHNLAAICKNRNGGSILRSLRQTKCQRRENFLFTEKVRHISPFFIIPEMEDRKTMGQDRRWNSTKMKSLWKFNLFAKGLRLELVVTAVCVPLLTQDGNVFRLTFQQREKPSFIYATCMRREKRREALQRQ